MQSRNLLIRKIKVGQKQLGFDDDLYRDFLVQVVGKNSCSKCSDGQLVDIIKAMQAKGVKYISKNAIRAKKYVGSGVKAKDEMERKIFALWADICELGKAKEPTPMGFKKLVLSMTNKLSIHACTDKELSNIIEVLKAIKSRK